MQIEVKFNSRLQGLLIGTIALLLSFICVSNLTPASNPGWAIFGTLLALASGIGGVVCIIYSVIGYISDLEYQERKDRGPRY